MLLTGLTVFTIHGQDENESELPDETQLLIHDVRVTTAPFHNLDTALEQGYTKFLECFQNGPELGMGQHYVNGELAGDDVLDALQPEALVYEPGEDGALNLVAFEYIVFADVWDSQDEERVPPTLFGQEFSLKTNVPDTPPFWALHLWVWSHNPQGLFADYNPLIFCPED